MSNIHITRGQSQILSTFFMMFGMMMMILSSYLILSIIIICFAIWIMLMSESVLLNKVQNEMHTALEEFNRKKEKENDQVLFFLRKSAILASPFESIEGAKQLCDKISIPCMVLSVNHQIIKANKLMNDVLGWNYPNLDNVHAHTINDPLMMSKIGEWAADPKNISKTAITSYYVYNNKNGEKIQGLMHAEKICVLGFFVTFYPSHNNAFSYDEIKELVISSKLQLKN